MRLLQDIERFVLEADGEEDKNKNLTADGESAIQQVLGRIFSVPSDSTRVVMLLNDADLKDRYLTAKGEAKITSKDSASDEQIAEIFSHADFQVQGEHKAENAFIFPVTGSFDLSKLTKAISAQRQYAVLFNVPKSLASNLTSNKPTDIENAREILTQIIAHKNYVATLNVSAIKKANVGALSDEHEREELFNIKTFITAYPVRAVIDAAREEQQEKDKNKQLTPDSDHADNGSAKPKVELTAEQQKLVKKIAMDARQLFFAASSKGWPTDVQALKELRTKLVNALSKDSRIAEDSWIPFIVKRFYSDIVKQDKNYNNLLKLLKDDANFMKLANGEEPMPDENDEDADTSNGQQDDQQDEPASTQSGEKTPAELADEIKSKGQDYADEVAKILSGKTAAPAAATPEVSTANLPDDVKAEVERLQKIKKNAINPKQREKAAADLATLLHREEEKARKKSKK